MDGHALSIDEIVARRLAQTRQLFLDVLGPRIEEIANARRKVETGAMRAEDGIAEIRAVCHKIAGSAGSLGFAELGDMANDVQNLADQLRDAGYHGSEAWDHVRPAADAFHDAARAVLRG
jgi:HPt (histidine-containing phosphotransfer) domain-containing protein